MNRLRLALATTLLTALPACGQSGPERAAYLTLMGTDTLVVEWMEFGEGSVDAWALVRGNRTTWSEYHLEMSPAGELTAFTSTTYAGGSSAGEVVRTERLVSDAEGRGMVTMQRGEESRREFTGENGSVPFVDMLHWPFETAMRWQIDQGGLGEAVPTFSGRGSVFPIIENDDGSFGLRHPSRGVSTMTLDDEGRILTLDGTGSTRAYDLTRVAFDALDQAAMGAAFGDRPLGALSGRGQIDDMVAGVHFTGDYGAPVRRGRDIFGQLLAYGVWWRTGANNATQFSLDGDIVIDGEVIPAGDYSLSSIPEEDGGVLIINTLTGQGGQTYDQDLDQARVQMRRSMLDEKVDVFEIRVVESDGGGRIELRWDDVVYWVPFTVG